VEKCDDSVVPRGMSTRGSERRTMEIKTKDEDNDDEEEEDRFDSIFNHVIVNFNVVKKKERDMNKVVFSFF
jgi:hypothetical protein